MANSLTYKKAGVNVDAGNALVGDIKNITSKIAKNWSVSSIGGFASMLDIKKIGMRDPIIVSSTDGVGTKLLLAIQTQNYRYIGHDLVAMCVNDLVVEGAKPLQFLDYYATGKLDQVIAKEIISSIAEACSIAGCDLVGGETAEMPGMYNDGDCDLAGFVIGAIEREALENRKNIAQDDVLIGVQSNGIHSNGYSLVRAIMNAHNIDINDSDYTIDGLALKDILLQPTKIYCDVALHLYAQQYIKRAVHITGGGFTDNIPRILPADLDAVIHKKNMPSLPIFEWLQQKGDVHDDDMYQTFNMGVGMVFICDKQHQEQVMQYITKMGDEAYLIGTIDKGAASVRYSA